MIIFNPFSPNSPVHNDMFKGRGAELNAINKALTQTKYGNPNHILFIGERGIGKTSLLNVADIFAQGRFIWSGEKFNFLVIRINLGENLCLVDFVINLKKSIERTISSDNPVLEGIKKTWDFISRFEAGGFALKREESEKNSAQIIQDFIYSLIDTVKSLTNQDLELKHKKDGIVFLIDESDKASKDLYIGAFLKNLAEALVAKNANNVLFILSGLPKTRDVLAESHESSLRLFQEFNLTPLSQKETAEVIQNGLDEVNKKLGVNIAINKEAQDLIFQVSEGYPHFIQQIGYSVLEVNNDNVIDVADVHNGNIGPQGAIQLIGNRYYMKSFYKDINVESQREILKIMAEDWSNWVEKKNIRKKFSGGVTVLTNGIRALLDKGIIIPKEGVRGVYRLQWASFALWIRIHQKTERKK